MSKRQADSAYIILAALVFGALMAWAGHTAGAMIIEDNEGKRYVAFTAEEFAALANAIKALREENAQLKDKLAKGGCT